MNPLVSAEIQQFRDQVDTPLHEASHTGDLGRVTALLRHGEVTAINQRNRLGCSPLRLAATGGHAAVVEVLLQHGADPDLSDIKTQTALYVAAKGHFVPCMRLLLRAGAHPDGHPRSLCTPIYTGAMDGRLDVITELVTSGADLNRSQISLGTFFSTPLYITIAYRKLACFCYLLRAGADPDAHACPAVGGQRHLGASQSLYHAAIRHDVPLVYAEELYAFGCNLYVRDDKGRLPHEMMTANQCAAFIGSLYYIPMPLMMQCRLRIRTVLGRHRLSSIKDLPLPTTIQHYLNFE